MRNPISNTGRFVALLALVFSLTAAANAAVPGITAAGSGGAGTFNLTAQQAYLNQPDGQAIYSWGYGCNGTNGTPTFAPTLGGATFSGAACPTMQVPGPTLIVTEGQPVTIQLQNALPTAAGNTSILFPGFQVSTSCPASTTAGAPQQGLLTCEAVPGGTVTYTFTASAPGTHPYYSGTQGDLQIEMGLYGSIVVLPKTPPANCANGTAVTNLYSKTDYGTANSVPGFPETDFRLSTAAYDHPASCYDREYLFQWAEMDARIHNQAETQVAATVASGVCASLPNPACSLNVQTEPYHPSYFLINGRSMPDLMDPNFAGEYPHQPYNANPHMHPGELTLVRTIGQGRWQHPFHEHANHVRILSRDGNLVLSSSTVTYPGNLTAPGLAGILMFNTDTTPGESFDGIFYFSGRGLNWDPFGHHPAASASSLSPFTITAISEGTGAAANTVTVTVSGTLPASVNNTTVTIAGFTGTAAGYNGSFTATSVTPGAATSTFSYTDLTAGLTAGAGGTATVNLGATSAQPFPTDPLASLSCTPDANGYNTGNPAALNYYEWCQDHNKPVQVAPFGDVAGGGPVTLPDPNVFTNGQWYGGTPYFGPDASLRAAMPTCGTTQNANCTTLNPANTQANPANERGWAFMWHSHNEREITTNNVFPGGMLMMMLVDSREFAIDESL